MKRLRFSGFVAMSVYLLAIAVQAQISVSVDPNTVFLGQQFTAAGTGFTANGTVVLHFADPFGVERLTTAVVAGANGAYQEFLVISSGSSNLPVGFYRHWAVDQTAGTRSADLFMTVTPAHVIVAPRPTSNKIDTDGNGYFESLSLIGSAFASSGFHRVDVKLYRRDCQGQETLAASMNGLRADYGPGNVFELNVLDNSQREVWDFRMDVFVSGSADSIVHRIEYGQAAEWTNLPMWDGTSTCTGAALFPVAVGETVLNKPLTAYPGDTLCVEIRLVQNPKAIDAFAFTVQVDPQLLTFVQAAPGTLTGGFIVVDAQETSAGSGTILCGGFGATAISVNSSGSLMRLCFKVQCQEGALSEIVVKNLVDDVAGLSTCCNAFACTVCKNDGDINHNGSLSPGDALCAFQIYLNGGKLAAGCEVPDFPCELVAADVSCDAAITPGDALAIFRRFLQGLPPAPCFGSSSLARREASRLQLALQPSVFVSETNREMIKLALRVDQPGGLSAFGGRLSYPQEKLEFMSVLRTSLTAEWTNLDARELAPGLLTFGGFNAAALENAAAGAVLEVLFATKEAPAVRSEDFVLSDLVDDFSAATVQAGNKNTESTTAIPQVFQLHQNFPNPYRFSSLPTATLIRFDLPGAAAMKVELAIYNIAGQLVRRLVTGNRAPGAYEVAWNGRDEQGRLVPSGKYLYRLKAGREVASKTLTVVR